MSYISIRESFEKMEEKMLSKEAQLARNTKGREKPEEECTIRTAYQKDRERIIYCKAFRRLKRKTQVFLFPEGDHYRTRLTHTLEVAQIGRAIARGLKLNEDLTEAIGLGHDLGHTPFGHAGERMLNSVCRFGFKHNLQSLRVVDYLEEENGLNLTHEVRDGIVNHTGKKKPSTLEGEIIKISDRIAYINHDMDDAIRGNVINKNQFPKKCIEVLGINSVERRNNMVKDIIINSSSKKEIKMSKEFQQAKDDLRSFLFDNLYLTSIAKKEEVKAENIVKELFNYFVNKPEKLPIETYQQMAKYDIERVVCDYIAGMTDNYAIKKYEDLFIPKSWF